MKSTSDNSRWKTILLPFSWLYGLGVWIRNRLYDLDLLKSTGFKVPLISVGNITVGGTGKTPHVEYLAALLKEEFLVATLSRGYKRKTRDFCLATETSGVREIGDEALQIKHHFPEITVAVDRRRVNGVETLLKLDPPVEVILLDDAYQHRSISPGYSILLMDYHRPIHRDLLLPAGRLREPASNSHRAQIILVTRSPENIKPIELREYYKQFKLQIGQHLYFTCMRYGDLAPVYPGIEKKEASWFKEREAGVLVVAGIAQPRSMREFAHSISARTRELFFPDHHAYTASDLRKITAAFRELKKEGSEVLVLTTEKDAMRLREQEAEQELKEAFHAVRIHVHFLNDDKKEFDRQILDYVHSNKRSSVLHQGEDQ